MALFRVQDLLDNDPHPEEIFLGYAVPEGWDEKDGSYEIDENRVTLTINMTDAVRDAYRDAVGSYIQSPRAALQGKGTKKRLDGWTETRFDKFCEAILAVGYVDSQNIMDTPSKDAMLAVVRKEIDFSQNLARKLMAHFQKDGRLIEWEDDEKN